MLKEKGIGPKPRKKKQTLSEQSASPLSDLAMALLHLKYSDMMDMAVNLSTAVTEKDVWPHGVKTPEDFARLLYGWAEGCEE